MKSSVLPIKFHKKILAIGVILLFIGIGIAPNIIADINHFNFNDEKPTLLNNQIIKIQNKEHFSTSFSLSSPEIISTENYTDINLKEQTSKTFEPNKPMLPIVTKVFILPFKTEIKDIEIIPHGQKIKKISNPIKRTPEIIPIGYLNIDEISSFKENDDSNYNIKIYPKKLYDYSINSGRSENDIVNYLTLRINPVRYDYINKCIIYFDNLDISINFKIPFETIDFGNEYDLLIITPFSFTKEVKPLVEHKNSYGIRSKLVTVEEILLGRNYPKQGRDKAEKVKYFIKYALDEWGIKYVMLFGGRKGGILNPRWWVPVRYSNIVDFIERSHLTDLYFADIYDSQGNFSSWDSNNDDVFGEWYTGSKDIIDMYPEVYIGRIPCKNKDEAKIMVDKIITYETTVYGTDWIKRFVGVAGDSYPNFNEAYYEGELATEAAFKFLEGFESKFLWTSTGNFTNKSDVIDAVNQGCGILMFSGHGNPKEWATHPPESESWIDVANSFEMDLYNNTNKLPIILVTSCWSSKFSTSYLEIINGILRNGILFFRKTSPPSGFYLYEWVPKCWSWAFCSLADTGSMAVIGNTGLGYGIHGEECLSGKSQFMEIQFCKSYSQGGEYLGEAHSNQLILYMTEFPPMEDKIDCKTTQELLLIGDPSLKIGGYPPN